jgi:8-oxo-dGTP pyrophosphatase MutT (NUDIX family)
MSVPTPARQTEHDRRPIEVPLAVAPARDVAAAVMVAEDGRYLLQLRDDLPHIHLPNHWALFGGGIEPGERPERTIRRELAEELGWTARAVMPLAVSVHALPPEGLAWRMHFFVVPFRSDEMAGMALAEGAAKGLFTLAEAGALERVAPWDLCAMMLHARMGGLFPAFAGFGE